jgi:hypothetical protein
MGHDPRRTGQVLLETAYCDWATKLPADSELTCSGVAIERK